MGGTVSNRHWRFVWLAVAVIMAHLLSPAMAEAQGRGQTVRRGDNTLQICHTIGNAGVRMLYVDPSAESDHLGHGDWHPIVFFEDADGDGFGGSSSILACVLPAGYSVNDLDCDDHDPTSYPGAIEILDDNRDNDCDGWIDEGWPSWGAAATNAARQAARAWMATAAVRKDSCHVNAALAFAGPFSVSGAPVQGKVQQALLAAGASNAVASGWDVAFTAAWRGWSDAITIPSLPWYPSFVVYPGPYAPPTPNVPMPLSTMLSVGRSGMTTSSLESRVASSIGPEADEPGASAAIHSFATAISARFDASLAIPVTAVMGEGPVPLFSPPWVPAGPVTDGSCRGGVFPTAPWN